VSEVWRNEPAFRRHSPPHAAIPAGNKQNSASSGRESLRLWMEQCVTARVVKISTNNSDYNNNNNNNNNKNLLPTKKRIQYTTVYNGQLPEVDDPF